MGVQDIVSLWLIGSAVKSRWEPERASLPLAAAPFDRAKTTGCRTPFLLPSVSRYGAIGPRRLAESARCYRASSTVGRLPLETLPRTFVTKYADIGRPEVVEGLYRDLEARPLNTLEGLNSWLLDWSDLDSWLDEEGSIRYVNMTCHTSDEVIEKRYLDFVENVQPLASVCNNRLEKKFLACEHRAALPRDRFEVFIRQVENSAAIFREANVPLETEDEKLRQQYQKVTGGLTVHFDGREQTMQQMGRYLESTDRAVRQEAWELIAAKWAEVQDEIETLYDKMVAVRHKIGVNAGFANYRDYAFKEMERFDYSAADCESFADAIAEIAVPAARRLADKRRSQLGIDSLRPWDMAVDPLGREPLWPFENAQQLNDGCARMFAKVHPDFAGQFDIMRRGNLLDLESRKGKAPGGYMMEYKGRRVPFIFMNAVGTHDDVQTMLHEGGHAFHVFAAAHEPLADLRDPPIEFAEVASMGMELIAGPHLGEFYSAADARRAWQDHLDGIVRFFPYMATIDLLQHWAYTHPTHGRDERMAAWLGIDRRFADWVDYRGHEQALSYAWHRKGHPFTVPFYYVEYGIAQLGALGVWLNSRKDYPSAVSAYRKALSLGGRRPLPELFSTAGVRFDFSAKTLGPMVSAAEGELK